MIIGYGRTSTVEQVAGLEAQERELLHAGCEKVFLEQSSSVGSRPKLDSALDFAREGDALVVTKLDRLARSVPHLWELVTKLEEKSVALRILNMGLDTATPTGRLMLNVLGSVAQFEREMMLERQREGIAKAKADGKYKGRKPTAQMMSSQVKELACEGATKRQIAARLGIAERSVYRILSPSTSATKHATSK